MERVIQVIDQDLQAHAKRLGLRAVSTFEFVSAEEVAAGFSALQQACEDPLRTREPVTEEVDVAVFVKAKAG